MTLKTTEDSRDGYIRRLQSLCEPRKIKSKWEYETKIFYFSKSTSEWANDQRSNQTWIHSEPRSLIPSVHLKDGRCEASGETPDWKMNSHRCETQQIQMEKKKLGAGVKQWMNWSPDCCCSGNRAEEEECAVVEPTVWITQRLNLTC